MTNKKEQAVVPLFTIESRLKRKLRKHLQLLGFTKTQKGELQPPSTSKECYRNLHALQRIQLIESNRNFIEKNLPKLIQYFADGKGIQPQFIAPRIELITSNTVQSDLFRLASLTWSVPVSQGYGRRMRFLVWDDNIGKLIGIFALGDPVFNLRVRDEYIGWNAEQRKKNLISIMDAYVLGAMPPYNLLLGGKLIACLIKTKEVKNAFKKKYADYTGIISRQQKKPSLIAVTTSSALGRSSIYNRLILNSHKYFRSTGFSSGWGHFHIPQSLFNEMLEFLRFKGHRYASNNRFGDGPNWRLRAIRQALTLLDLNPNLLRHGINREVFICEIASNSQQVLRGETNKPVYENILDVKSVGELAIDRWIEPRAKRNSDFSIWQRDKIKDMLYTSLIYSKKSGNKTWEQGSNVIG